MSRSPHQNTGPDSHNGLGKFHTGKRSTHRGTSSRVSPLDLPRTPPPPPRFLGRHTVIPRAHTKITAPRDTTAPAAA
jgi:hypothetical protein